MKSYLLLICIVVIIGGCATPRPQNHLYNTCSGKNKKELVEAVAALMVSEGFDIQLANENIGIVQASKTMTSWGTTYAIRWKISCSDNSVKGNACLAIVGSSINKSMVNADDCTPMGEKSSTDWEPYWVVRKGLEKLCGINTVIEIEQPVK